MWTQQVRENKLKLTIGVALIAMIIVIVTTWWYSNERALIALAKNVYWEALAANEPELSARMVAHVTVERAKAKKSYWGGSDIHDVVYARKAKKNGGMVCQFTWTCKAAAKKEPGVSAKWELAMQIAREELAGKFTPPAQLAGATSYLNPKYSGRSNICEFKTRLILLGKAEPESQHVFYRDPKGAIDKLVLPKRADVPECSPVKKKQKKKANSAAR